MNYRFPLVEKLPPYVFAVINQLKMDARHRGEDIIDLGMGNPDLATPDPIVDKLVEASRNPRNHRYSASRGIPNLRGEISRWYARRYGVEIDPETEAIATIEGLRAERSASVVDPIPAPGFPGASPPRPLRGAEAGATLAHPHGQIWANETVPDELAREIASQKEYYQRQKSFLLEDYLRLELEQNERIVCANQHFVALVQPFEHLLLAFGQLRDDPVQEQGGFIQQPFR